MIMLDEHSCRFMQLVIPLIAGLGMGLLFRSPFVAMEKAFPDKDRASMTGCFFFVRFIGTSVGLVSYSRVSTFITLSLSLTQLYDRPRRVQSLILGSNKPFRPDSS